ncbi:MAG: MFS transporter [Chloroflexi bacterium]|nr:MFS transporter [Chloroflexota bacterium]
MKSVPDIPTTRAVWLMRAYYLLWTGAGGFIFPFISLFYKQQGLTGTQMGWLGTITSIVSLISAPLLGRLSDKLSNPRKVLQFCLFGSAMLMALLSQQSSFLWMAIIIGLEAFIGGPIYPLSDAQALMITNEKQGYGSIRLWGSLGWAITAFLGGLMVQRAGLVTVFIGYATLYGICIFMLQWIITSAGTAKKETDPQPSLKAVVRSLFRDRALIGLALSLAVLWLTANGRHHFETIYMQELGASDQVIGWAYTYPALMELPIMLWADRLMQKFSAGRLLAAGILLEGLSMLVIVIFPTLESMLFMRAASGLYYSFYAIASVAYAVERAPAAQAATVLSLYFVSLGGVIALIASPISGAIYDRSGAYPLYVIAAVGALLAWLILVLTHPKANQTSAQDFAPE